MFTPTAGNLGRTAQRHVPTIETTGSAKFSIDVQVILVQIEWLRQCWTVSKDVHHRGAARLGDADETQECCLVLEVSSWWWWLRCCIERLLSLRPSRQIVLREISRFRSFLEAETAGSGGG